MFEANYEPLSEHLIMEGQSDCNLLDTIARGGAKIEPSLKVRWLVGRHQHSHNQTRQACACFVPGLPHVILIELRQALISYQDYHVLVREGILDACCHAVVLQVEMLEVSCEHFPESTNPLVYCLLAFNEDDEVKQDMGLRIVKRAVNCLSALSQPKAGLTCGRVLANV